MARISFSEAASAAGIHFNTLRYWRTKGKLKTAEKVVENGRELWTVEYEEVELLARQSPPKHPAKQFVDIGGVLVDKGPSNGPTSPQAGGIEQSLLVMRDAWIKPYQEAIDRLELDLQRERAERAGLVDRLEARALEVGALRQKVEQLETVSKTIDNIVINDSQQAPTSPAPAISTQIPAGSPSEATAPKQPAKRRRWLPRWLTGNRP
jgi:hypothetical protein